MDFTYYWQYANIQVVDISIVYLTPHTKIPASFISTSSFIFVRRGSAQLLLNEQVFTVNGVHLFHVGPNKWMEWHTGNEPVEYIILTYEAYIGNKIPSNIVNTIESPFNLVYQVSISRSDILYNILEKMLKLIKEKETMAQFQVKVLFYQWISQVLGESKTSTQHIHRPYTLVTMALEYMLENYAEAITIDSLATAMGCSPGHLSNRFKQILNRGPIDCLINLRMKKASKLLVETKLSLRFIAEATGYQDGYYFSKAFKKHTGISPSVFRKGKYISEDFTSTYKRFNIVDSEVACYIDNDNHYADNVGKGESINMFNKRAIIPVSLLLAFGLLLGSCSSAGKTSTTSGSATESSTNTEKSSDGTRTISTTKGDVKVPENPKRVVTDFYVGHLLALGIKPVGSLGLYTQSPYLEGKIEGIKDIGENLETIVELQPDLIITGNAKNLDSYSKIAPTVLVTADANVRGEVKQIGNIVGKEEAAATWEKEFDKKIEDKRTEAKGLIEDGETVTVFAGGIEKTITIYGKGYTGRSIYNELQLPIQKNAEKEISAKQPWIDISNEVVEKYAGDYIFMAVDLKTESYDYVNDAIWGTLKAVKENKLFEIDGYRFWFSDPISVEGQVSDIVKMMTDRKVENKK